MSTQPTNYEIMISPTEMFELVRSALINAASKHMFKEYYEARESIGRAEKLLSILKQKMYDLEEVTRARLK